MTLAPSPGPTALDTLAEGPPADLPVTGAVARPRTVAEPDRAEFVASLDRTAARRPVDPIVAEAGRVSEIAERAVGAAGAGTAMGDRPVNAAARAGVRPSGAAGGGPPPATAQLADAG